MRKSLWPRFVNTKTRWGILSRLIHWLTAALIIVQVVLASIAAELPLGMRKLAFLARHKSFGLTLLALVVIRLAWRSMSTVPQLPDTLKAYERIIARLTHFTLYVLLFALPLSGWMMSSARGFSVSWFGLIQLPDLVPKNRALYEALLGTHEALAWFHGAVLLIHVAAALKHQFVLGDDVLRRMLPFYRSLGED